MTTSRTNPREYMTELAIPGKPSVHTSLNAPNALARALTPDYAGMNEEVDMRGITGETLSLVSAENLRKSLIDVPTPGRTTIEYHSPEDHRRHLIAVTAVEHRLMHGNIRGLGERAVARAVHSREKLGLGMSPENWRRTDQAGPDAVQALLTSLERYKSGLDNRLSRIARFQEAAHGSHRGLARMGGEAAMREQVVYVRTQMFRELLAAVTARENWSRHEAQSAEKVLDVSIFFERESNHHIDRFEKLLALMKEWNGYKNAITLNRMAAAKKYLRDKKLPDARS